MFFWLFGLLLVSAIPLMVPGSSVWFGPATDGLHWVLSRIGISPSHHLIVIVLLAAISGIVDSARSQMLSWMESESDSLWGNPNICIDPAPVGLATRDPCAGIGGIARSACENTDHGTT
ncbi:hypothetical protein Atc_1261 [Acidithiobacillus caldus SM-1]|uniref:Uncharacterized protein n=1 Tax=Acidithiobacillus caldus (strain SM-1) TaxID=990288 RepID=F9ZNT0_ACICS|nr:hypothetical protein [Acidithiobacillus caldus]AEK57910.1 hypothetical protein Atc_1261 [Acidithiobacillus caldus SM-1]